MFKVALKDLYIHEEVARIGKGGGIGNRDIHQDIRNTRVSTRVVLYRVLGIKDNCKTI